MAEAKKKLFKDGRSRTIFIVTGAVTVLAMGSGLMLSGKGAEQGLNSGVAPVASVNSAPGGNTAPRYQQYVKDENNDRAEEAEATGGSAIPTIFTGSTVDEEPFIVEDESPVTPAASTQQTQSPTQATQQTYQAPVPREPSKAMAAQMKALMGSWSRDIETASGNFQVVQKDVVDDVVITGDDGQGDSAPVTEPPLYRAGSMISAVIDTELSSDYPGKVRATIVSGPLRGAYVIGSFKRQQDTVLLEFSTLSLPSKGSQAVSMVAVDPHTGNSGIQSDVDYHTLYRYASLMGGVLVRSLGVYGELTAQESTGSTTDANGNTVVTRGEIDDSDKVVAALGEGFQGVADSAGSSVGEGFNREATVTVKQNESINLFVLQDLPKSLLK